MKNRFLVAVAIAGLLGSSLSARDASLEDKITSLYVSYFNRAPDFNGLSYWKSHGEEYLNAGKNGLLALQELSAGFATHPTFVSMYSSMGNEDFVKAIYKNALGRDGDAGGITYWTGLLDSGKQRSDMVAEFMNASLTVDLTAENYPTLSQADLDAAIERQTLIANKVQVAEAFVNTLTTNTNVEDTQNPENDPAYLASIKVLENVGVDQTTVEDAIGKIYALKDAPSTAISMIQNSWGAIQPDYSFKNPPSIPEDGNGDETVQEAASKARFIYIFNNMAYNYYEEYVSGEYNLYSFTTLAATAHCTDYGFTAAEQTTNYNYQGINVLIYSSPSADYSSARVCTEADYAGTEFGGNTNGLFYGNEQTYE